MALQHVGPASALEMELKPRLNFITGDNGLGKSFMLDVAWWALTRTWSGRPAAPHRNPKAAPRISYCLASGEIRSSIFTWETRTWPVDADQSGAPCLVIYAQVDGGFSVWDPARNTGRKAGDSGPAAYRFKADDVWEGLEVNGKPLCNGLIRDWTTWQGKRNRAFDQLQHVITRLSPPGDKALAIGEPMRIDLDDARDFPTLIMPYGQTVPVVHTSAGIRRIIALAYLLVWAWQEHLAAAELTNRKPVENIVFLVDEIEAHLHPRWQRSILRALLEVADALTHQKQTSVQLLTVTHSPLVLASAEPEFDSEQDSIWAFEERNGFVYLEQQRWRRLGDASNWLGFLGIEEPVALEAEQALHEAYAILSQEEADLETAEAIDRELRTVLSDVNPFWIRWSSWLEALRGAS
ncbi:MAG: AAA family ATPase [Acidobacteriota bacterium]|nr:AAA family ATPase [Acidobacteriota bacterium]